MYFNFEFVRLIFFIFILIIQFSFSQDFNIKKIEIKSLDTNNIDDNSFSLNKLSPKGLTSKPTKQYFTYEINSESKKDILVYEEKDDDFSTCIIYKSHITRD